ncbi:MAG: pentapeptide repeat-containing protein, partial [Xanthobacteraceae bacterium]
DQPTVMEVLAAFVREHSRERRLQQEPDADMAEGTPPEGAFCPADVQAAVTVVGRRNPANDHETPAIRRAGPDFHFANLARANLFRAKLARANLARANLAHAWLIDADLTGALLADANLSHTVLHHTILAGAELIGADLTSADLYETDLTGAVLAHADLSGAKLIRPTLTGANLYHANLSDIDFGFEDLTGADLTDARYSLGARVPDGWARDPDSGRLKPIEGDIVDDDPDGGESPLDPGLSH